MNESTFIDDILLEAEQKEQELTLAHYDLIVKEISSLYDKIEAVTKEAESEIQIISDWALNKMASLRIRSIY